MNMNFWGISESRKRSISYRRNSLIDFSKRHLKLLPKIDLGDLDDIDTENNYTVDVKLEYDSGDYLYLFNGMVNMDNFNIIANYLDIGKNLVVFNLKEILHTNGIKVSDENLRKALLTFKLSLDIDKLAQELSEIDLFSSSLFRYAIIKDNPLGVNREFLIKLLYALVSCMDMAKAYLLKYKMSFEDLSIDNVNNVKLDRNLQYNIFTLNNTEMSTSFTNNLDAVKFSSHYSASEPYSYDVNSKQFKMGNLSSENDRDNKGITGNILEVVKLYDGDLEKIFDPKVPSIIDDYVKDFGSKYQNKCEKALHEDSSFFRNNRLLDIYTGWRNLSDRRSKVNTEYMISVDVTNISNIIQDLKSLRKSVDILTVKR